MTLSLLYRSSENKLTTQSGNIITYASHFLNEITTTMSQLIPLSTQSCEQASPTLHYRAAFTNGVRAFYWSEKVLLIAPLQRVKCKRQSVQSILKLIYPSHWILKFSKAPHDAK